MDPHEEADGRRQLGSNNRRARTDSDWHRGVGHGGFEQDRTSHRGLGGMDGGTRSSPSISAEETQRMMRRRAGGPPQMPTPPTFAEESFGADDYPPQRMRQVPPYAASQTQPPPQHSRRVQDLSQTAYQPSCSSTTSQRRPKSGSKERFASTEPSWARSGGSGSGHGGATAAAAGNGSGGGGGSSTSFGPAVRESMQARLSSVGPPPMPGGAGRLS